MQAFGMTKVGETHSTLADGVYLSDGVVNMALLKYKTDAMAGPKGKDHEGLHHIGFWVDDIEAAKQKVTDAGAKWFMGEVADETAFYEVKYHTPDGTMFDITQNGWGGATK
jgi:catechol 2,3-dioxygenase-like lactoylglutathione lyase family enzyme